MIQVKLQIGDSVKVKTGVIDSDFQKYDMSGWQGRLINVDEENDQVEIEFDSITLRQITKDYIVDSLNAECDYSVMYYSYSDVEITEPRDTIADVKSALQELYVQYGNYK